MSAALVLATIHQPVRYSYVGGTVRSQDINRLASRPADQPAPFLLSTQPRHRVVSAPWSANFRSWQTLHNEAHPKSVNAEDGSSPAELLGKPATSDFQIHSEPKIREKYQQSRDIIRLM